MLLMSKSVCVCVRTHGESFGDWPGHYVDNSVHRGRQQLSPL